MPRKILSIEQALALLAQTPPRIAEITAGLTTAQLHSSPGPDKWSANEVLADLRSCADVWGNCMKTILDQDTPTIRALNPRTYIKQTDYPKQKFHPSFRAFAKQRAALLAVLKPLPPKSWSRKATITGAGSPLVLTVLSYANRMAIHERAHLKQFQRIAGPLRAER